MARVATTTSGQEEEEQYDEPNIDEGLNEELFDLPGEITMHGVTLSSFKVMANGLGFDVHFTVPLAEAGHLPALSLYIQRLCELKVTKFSRRAVRAVSDDDDDVWSGSDAA